MRVAKKYKNGGSMVYAHLFGNFDWQKRKPGYNW